VSAAVAFARRTRRHAKSFLASLFAILLSVESGGAVLPWATGMTIATVAPIERFRCYPV
jgi:hypothetical protein